MGSNSPLPLDWGDRYFERQTLARCGMHALNNLVGGPQFVPDDLVSACRSIILETGEFASDHATAMGWYSHSVLSRVLQETVPPRWRLRFSPLLPNEVDDFYSDTLMYGALVNHHGEHWVAVVKHMDLLWNVDSCSIPRVLRLMDFRAMLLVYPETYPLLANCHLS